MEQTNNNFFKAIHLSSLIKTNTFTPRSPHQQFIPTLLKLANLKQQQRVSLTNFNIKLADHQAVGKHGLVKIKQSSLENVSVLQQISPQSVSQHQNKSINDKFIDKLKLNQSQGTSHKRDYNSYLQKCRIVTQSYDQLKKEVIKSKFPKSRHKCDKIYKSNENYYKANISGITHKCQQRSNQKENSLQMQRNSKNKTKHIRNKSYSESSKKSQRYMQISVADFMQEEDYKISEGLCKKFEQYQKEIEKKQSKSTQENYQQAQSQHHLSLGKKRNKKIQPITNERLVYPIITHAF